MERSHIRVSSSIRGRIISLEHTGYEWLSRTTGAAGERAITLSGWDEIAPSVAPSTTDAGRSIPSHGDLVGQVWTGSAHGCQRAEFSSFAGQLERRVDTRDGGMTLSYRLTTDEDQSLLWSAHPIMDWLPGTSIEVLGLPDARWVKPGSPRPVNLDSALTEVNAAADGKYFLPSDARAHGVVVRRRDRRTLRLMWDPALVKYLGLWLNEGSWGGSPVLAVEPTTGWGDSLDDARESGHAMFTRAGESVEWWLEVSFKEENT